MKKIILAGIMTLLIVSCVSTPPVNIKEETETPETTVETQTPPLKKKPIQKTATPDTAEADITFSHEEIQTGRVFSKIFARTFENNENIYYDFYSEYNPLNFLLGWKGNDLTYILKEDKRRKIGNNKVFSFIIYASGFNYTEIVLTNKKEESDLICPLLLQENSWNEIIIPISDFKGAREFKPGLYNIAVTVPFNANYRMGHLIDETEKGLLCFDLKIRNGSEENINGNSSLIDLPDRNFIIHELATGEQELILPDSRGAVNFNLNISGEEDQTNTKFTISTMPRSKKGFLKINMKNLHNDRPVYWRSDLRPSKALETDNGNKYIYALTESNTWMVWDGNPGTQLELLFSYQENEILNFTIETKPFKED